MRSIEDRAFQRVDEKGNRCWIHFLWPPRRSLMALQMTWHARCRKGGVAPLGLKNLGNSCYLNSVLQCLTYTPPLAQFCLSFRHSSLCKSVFANREECPFCILERQIARSLTLDGANTTESPAKILKCLSLFAEHFRLGHQEDAHEFLRYVIDACHNSCIKIHKQSGGGGASGGVANGDSKVDDRSGPGTVMKEIFGGALLSQVKCLACKGDSNKVDEIMDICLDVSQSSSLKDALARFFQPEVLDGNNKYSCSNCKKLSVAKKQMFILRAPNVLVIQLKRFEGIHGGKINRNIDFDELLGLSKFMANTSQDLEPEYSLFGCIIHSGFSPESGHYYAYIKDTSGRWFCCNDAHVSLSSSQEVLSEKVYMLFYIRTNCSPKPNKSALSCNGFKPSIVNGSSVESQKTAETLKPMIANTNGASSTNNGSSLLKNSKAFSSSQFKPINLKNLETKRTFPNDNGKLNIQKKRAIGEDTTIHACNSLSENKMLQKFETLTTSNLDAANVDVSPDIVRQQNKHLPLWPNGNRCSHPSDRHPNTEDTESAAAIRKGPSDSSSPKLRIDKYHKVNSEVHNAKGRENPDQSSNGSTTLPRENGSCKNQLSCEKRHSQEIEKFKEMLSEEASTELHSCGWVDRVQDFMRAKKRQCMQAANASYDKSSIRKQLISDAKKTFILQIPESLKERLIERLRSFSQETPCLDP